MVARALRGGADSEHDSTHFDEVLDVANTNRDVYADRDFPSSRRSEMLKALSFRAHSSAKPNPASR